MKNTEKPTLFDMVILGGGPAGFTAALYAARAGLSALVLEQLSPGGQMALSHQIDNYPGFEDGIDGFTLAQKMEAQALRFGASVELAEVRSVDLSSNPKVIQSSEGTFYGKTVVIATGAVPRTLGLPEEQALTGRGLHYCAACDGMFYRGKTVVVVGGGNSAAAASAAPARPCAVPSASLSGLRQCLRPWAPSPAASAACWCGIRGLSIWSAASLSSYSA